MTESTFNQIFWIYIEIVIVDSNPSLESDLYHNCPLNSLESKFQLLTIRIPNRLSLDDTIVIWNLKLR